MYSDTGLPVSHHITLVFPEPQPTLVHNWSWDVKSSTGPYRLFNEYEIWIQRNKLFATLYCGRRTTTKLLLYSILYV